MSKKIKPNLSCFEAVDYLLAKAAAEEEGSELISNLKLQKLLYYAQGVHLALHDIPLFPEEIQAWMHGPVVPAVYQKYKDSGYEALPSPEPGTVDFSRYTDEEKETLDEIYRVFGQFSAWRLREMTHGEPPWQEHFRDGATHIVISQEAMRRYFKTQLESE